MPSQTAKLFLSIALVLVDAAPMLAHAQQTTTGKCTLEVSGKTYINGACAIDLDKDGSFTIRAPSARRVDYFAVVSLTGKGKADGFWNEDKGANHAHTPLGALTRNGACWVGAKAKVCAWK